MAAITYAMLPIFNKNALKEMDNITMSAYAFLIAAIIMCFRVNPIHTISKIDNMRVLMYILSIGIIPTAMSYIVYSKGDIKRRRVIYSRSSCIDRTCFISYNRMDTSW